MTRNKLPLLLLTCILTASCAQRLQQFEQAVEDEIKGVNDAYAAGATAAVCGMSVGAYFRLKNTKQQEGIILICSPGKTELPNPPPAEEE